MAGSDQVNRRLMEHLQRVKAAVAMYSEQTAAKMEEDAKVNKPWQDQTGAARQGLFGYTFQTPQTLETRIAHGVDYGVYLELANQGRYAILTPTTRKFATQYFEDIRKLVGKR